MTDFDDPAGQSGRIARRIASRPVTVIAPAPKAGLMAGLMAGAMVAGGLLPAAGMLFSAEMSFCAL
jgi:hypothetical protein